MANSIAPLSNSRSKEELLRHLAMPAEIYTQMAREVDVVYEWLINDERHLVDQSKGKPKPYAWSDFTSRAKDEAMALIVQSTTPSTQHYWNLAVPQKDCDNWLARWFLYHKCRHRDGRNREARQREDSHVSAHSRTRKYGRASYGAWSPRPHSYQTTGPSSAGAYHYPATYTPSRHHSQVHPHDLPHLRADQPSFYSPSGTLSPGTSPPTENRSTFYDPVRDTQTHRDSV